MSDDAEIPKEIDHQVCCLNEGFPGMTARPNNPLQVTDFTTEEEGVADASSTTRPNNPLPVTDFTTDEEVVSDPSSTTRPNNPLPVTDYLLA